MFFFLSKVLNFLFMPLSWIFILLLVSFIWKRRSSRLRWAAVIVLFVFGNNFILNEVNSIWEVPITLEEDLKKHKVAVVLGGYAYYSPKNDRLTFRNSSDRLLQGLHLYHQGKVDKLILSGGSGYLLQPEMRESVFVGEFLEDLSIPKEDLIIESQSRNTKENAAYTAALLQERGWDKQEIVLVTSAFHMRRSRACFEKQGLQVATWSSDPNSGDRFFYPSHLLLPSSEALSQWNILIHEWVGFISYKVMGYV